MIHIMLDLETLGNGNNAAIVAIGACEFDPHGDGYAGTTFYKKVSPDSSVKAGMQMDASTVLWWLKQSSDAQFATFEGDGIVDLHTALSYFCGFVEQRGGSKDVAVWGNGATFDCVVIRNAFKAVNLPVPWSFRGDKCYRTVVNLLPETRRPVLVRNGTAHNALDDAITQAIHLQKCYKELGL